MSDKLTTEDLRILKAHFKPEQHQFDYNKNAYIKEQAICNRIEDVDPAWSLSEPKIFWRDGLGGVSICEVTVVITIKGVSRGGVGQKEVVGNKSKSAEANQAVKSAATDALKRAARLFGIGRYILDFGKSVSDTTSLTRWFAESDTNGWHDANIRAYWNDFTEKGLTKEQILASLGVDKLSDWRGSYSNAIDRTDWYIHDLEKQQKAGN